MPELDVCGCVPRCVTACGLDNDPLRNIWAGNVERLESLLPVLRLQQDKLDQLLAQALTEGKSGRRYQLARILIENGANPNSMADKYKTPIHLAMERGLCDELQILLTYHADPNIRSPTPSLNTALHWAIRGFQAQRYNNEKHGVACIQLLLNNCKGIINDTNGDGYTAVYLACMLGQWQIAMCLIEHGASIDNEIYNKTARALIESSDNSDLKSLVDSKPIEIITPPSTELIVQLRNSLSNGNQDEFLNLIHNDYVDFKKIVNETGDHCSLLQIACDEDHVRAVEELIKADSDVNMISKGDYRYPVMIAVTNKNHEILKLLLESEKCDLSVVNSKSESRTALHIAALEHDNLECFKLLLKYSSKSRLNIDAQDFRDCTALHYAAKKNKHEMVQILLSQRANIFITDYENTPAFFYIRKNDVEEYLDGQISIEKAPKGDTLVFDYDFIAYDRTEKSANSSPSSNVELKPLNGVREETVKNFEFVSTQLEMKPLKMLANSPEHRSLLKHPVFRSFLHIKWYQICWFFYFNFLFYLLFTATISYHVFSVIAVNSTNETMNSGEERSENDMSWILSVFLLALIALRELFQFILSPSRYFLQYENWMEMILIILTAIMLTSNNVTNLKSVSAIVILLMFTELVLLTGQLPLFSTYIIMFFKVLSSFAQLLLWYSLLIIGFGFSFYILFTKHDEESNDESDEFFSNIFVSLFKTIIMTTGEFESGDLKFGSVAVTSHIIFVLFIFFVAIVLLNLLTGLAVSDTQAIRDEAELHFCIAQARLYSQIEAVLLGGSYFVCPSLKRKIGSYVLVLSQLITYNKDNFHICFKLNDGTMQPNLNGHCRNPMFGQCGQKCPIRNKICKWCLIFNTIVKDARIIAEKGTETHDVDFKLLMQKLEEIEAKRGDQTQFNRDILNKIDKMNAILEGLRLKKEL